MGRMIKAKVDDKLINVELIKANDATVLVRLSSGAVIKRHKIKHSVDMGDIDEKITEEIINSDPVIIHSPRHS